MKLRNGKSLGMTTCPGFGGVARCVALPTRKKTVCGNRKIRGMEGNDRNHPKQDSIVNSATVQSQLRRDIRSSRFISIKFKCSYLTLISRKNR